MRIRLSAGLGLDYTPTGQGDVTLLLLHPIGLNRGVWSALAADLASDYRVLSVDLPGHGESDMPVTPIRMELMVAAVSEAASICASGKLVLVGCSMGSAVATAVAAAAPASVAALVLSSASYSRSPDRHANLTKRAAEARRGMQAILETTMKRWFTPATMATRPHLVAEVRNWLLAGDPIVHGWCWEMLRDFEYVPHAPALSMPTLVIGGAEDQSAAPAAVKALADAIAGAEYRQIEGAGHLSPMEKPQEFAAALREFLGRRLA